MPVEIQIFLSKIKRISIVHLCKASTRFESWHVAINQVTYQVRLAIVELTTVSIPEIAALYWQKRSCNALSAVVVCAKQRSAVNGTACGSEPSKCSSMACSVC